MEVSESSNRALTARETAVPNSAPESEEPPVMDNVPSVPVGEAAPPEVQIAGLQTDRLITFFDAADPNALLKAKRISEQAFSERSRMDLTLYQHYILHLQGALFASQEMYNLVVLQRQQNQLNSRISGQAFASSEENDPELMARSAAKVLSELSSQFMNLADKIAGVVSSNSMNVAASALPATVSVTPTRHEESLTSVSKCQQHDSSSKKETEVDSSSSTLLAPDRDSQVGHVKEKSTESNVPNCPQIEPTQKIAPTVTSPVSSESLDESGGQKQPERVISHIPQKLPLHLNVMELILHKLSRDAKIPTSRESAEKVQMARPSDNEWDGYERVIYRHPNYFQPYFIPSTYVRVMPPHPMVQVPVASPVPIIPAAAPQASMMQPHPPISPPPPQPSPPVRVWKAPMQSRTMTFTGLSRYHPPASNAARASTKPTAIYNVELVIMPAATEASQDHVSQANATSKIPTNSIDSTEPGTSKESIASRVLGKGVIPATAESKGPCVLASSIEPPLRIPLSIGAGGMPRYPSPQTWARIMNDLQRRVTPGHNAVTATATVASSTTPRSMSRVPLASRATASTSHGSSRSLTFSLGSPRVSALRPVTRSETTAQQPSKTPNSTTKSAIISKSTPHSQPGAGIKRQSTSQDSTAQGTMRSESDLSAVAKSVAGSHIRSRSIGANPPVNLQVAKTTKIAPSSTSTTIRAQTAPSGVRSEVGMSHSTSQALSDAKRRTQGVATTSQASHLSRTGTRTQLATSATRPSSTLARETVGVATGQRAKVTAGSVTSPRPSAAAQPTQILRPGTSGSSSLRTSVTKPSNADARTTIAKPLPTQISRTGISSKVPVTRVSGGSIIPKGTGRATSIPQPQVVAELHSPKRTGSVSSTSVSTKVFEEGNSGLRVKVDDEGDGIREDNLSEHGDVDKGAERTSGDTEADPEATPRTRKGEFVDFSSLFRSGESSYSGGESNELGAHTGIPSRLLSRLTAGSRSRAASSGDGDEGSQPGTSEQTNPDESDEESQRLLTRLRKRQERAEIARKRQLEKYRNVQHMREQRQSEGIRKVQEDAAQKASQSGKLLQERLERAAALHRAFLDTIRRRAGDEAEKVRAAGFVLALRRFEAGCEANDRREEISRKLAEGESRRNALLARRMASSALAAERAERAAERKRKAMATFDALLGGGIGGNVIASMLQSESDITKPSASLFSSGLWWSLTHRQPIFNSNSSQLFSPSSPAQSKSASQVSQESSWVALLGSKSPALGLLMARRGGIFHDSSSIDQVNEVEPSSDDTGTHENVGNEPDYTMPLLFEPAPSPLYNPKSLFNLGSTTPLFAPSTYPPMLNYSTALNSKVGSFDIMHNYFPPLLAASHMGNAALPNITEQSKSNPSTNATQPSASSLTTGLGVLTLDPMLSGYQHVSHLPSHSESRYPVLGNTSAEPLNSIADGLGALPALDNSLSLGDSRSTANAEAHGDSVITPTSTPQMRPMLRSTDASPQRASVPTQTVPALPASPAKRRIIPLLQLEVLSHTPQTSEAGSKRAVHDILERNVTPTTTAGQSSARFISDEAQRWLVTPTESTSMAKGTVEQPLVLEGHEEGPKLACAICEIQLPSETHAARDHIKTPEHISMADALRKRIETGGKPPRATEHQQDSQSAANSQHATISMSKRLLESPYACIVTTSELERRTTARERAQRNKLKKKNKRLRRILESQQSPESSETIELKSCEDPRNDQLGLMEQHVFESIEEEHVVDDVEAELPFEGGLDDGADTRTDSILALADLFADIDVAALALTSRSTAPESVEVSLMGASNSHPMIIRPHAARNRRKKPPKSLQLGASDLYTEHSTVHSLAKELYLATEDGLGFVAPTVPSLKTLTEALAAATNDVVTLIRAKTASPHNDIPADTSASLCKLVDQSLALLELLSPNKKWITDIVVQTLTPVSCEPTHPSYLESTSHVTLTWSFSCHGLFSLKDAVSSSESAAAVLPDSASLFNRLATALREPLGRLALGQGSKALFETLGPQESKRVTDDEENGVEADQDEAFLDTIHAWFDEDAASSDDLRATVLRIDPRKLESLTKVQNALDSLASPLPSIDATENAMRQLIDGLSECPVMPATLIAALERSLILVSALAAHSPTLTRELLLTHSSSYSSRRCTIFEFVSKGAVSEPANDAGLARLESTEERADLTSSRQQHLSRVKLLTRPYVKSNSHPRPQAYVGSQSTQDPYNPAMPRSLRILKVLSVITAPRPGHGPQADANDSTQVMAISAAAASNCDCPIQLDSATSLQQSLAFATLPAASLIDIAVVGSELAKASHSATSELSQLSIFQCLKNAAQQPLTVLFERNVFTGRFDTVTEEKDVSQREVASQASEDPSKKRSMLKDLYTWLANMPPPAADTKLSWLHLPLTWAGPASAVGAVLTALLSCPLTDKESSDISSQSYHRARRARFALGGIVRGDGGLSRLLGILEMMQHRAELTVNAPACLRCIDLSDPDPNISTLGRALGKVLFSSLVKASGFHDNEAEVNSDTISSHVTAAGLDLSLTVLNCFQQDTLLLGATAAQASLQVSLLEAPSPGPQQNSNSPSTDRLLEAYLSVLGVSSLGNGFVRRSHGSGGDSKRDSTQSQDTERADFDDWLVRSICSVSALQGLYVCGRRAPKAFASFIDSNYPYLLHALHAVLSPTLGIVNTQDQAHESTDTIAFVSLILFVFAATQASSAAQEALSWGPRPSLLMSISHVTQLKLQAGLAIAGDPKRVVERKTLLAVAAFAMICIATLCAASEACWRVIFFGSASDTRCSVREIFIDVFGLHKFVPQSNGTRSRGSETDDDFSLTAHVEQFLRPPLLSNWIIRKIQQRFEDLHDPVNSLLSDGEEAEDT